MINKAQVKELSEELNIPFANILSGVICETIVRIIAETEYGKKLWLCNGEDLCLENYKTNQPRRLYFTYYSEQGQNLMKTVMPKAMRIFMDKAAKEELKIGGQFEQYGLLLTVTVDSMYIPIQIFLNRTSIQSVVPVMEEIKLTLEKRKTIKYMAYPKEQVLATHLFEIVGKLELINDMSHYLEAYEIITQYPVNGRKVKEALTILCQEGHVEIKANNIALMEKYSSYSYMKKKWKVLLRQTKRSEPEWTDLNNCLISFLRPIWFSMEKKTVFLGDWMPQLRRFLD